MVHADEGIAVVSGADVPVVVLLLAAWSEVLRTVLSGPGGQFQCVEAAAEGDWLAVMTAGDAQNSE